ncbi:MAG TPA: murein biosynthesis integral membrane protein MurJ [Patescibacteria group bacterium]|jgi:putative peptidoglycan lipid II flippase|nr:murein biosynthesis integral membrane protein MurJ [Patescibacteria group bacterium]
MINKLKKLESTFHIGQATIIIASFTLLSRVTGFARDILLARTLGLSADSDIYFTAFRIPDLVYNLLILGTLSVAFIPVFSQYYLKDKPRAFAIASTILNISAIGMAFICLIIFFLATPLTKLVAPGFSPEQIHSTAMITRIMMLSPIIFTISNVFSSVLISLKKFLIVNIAPLVYNLGIIIGIVFLYPRFGLVGLAYGVILGALLHASIQLPEALRHGFKWKPVINYMDPGVRKIGALFLPRIVGLDNSYVNLIIVSIIGSSLATGSITAFNYANNIQAVALGIFALSSAVAIFPVLSEYFAKDDTKGFVSTLQHTIIRVLYFIIPVTIITLLLRAHIVRLLLGYGACDWTCTVTTFDTLGILSLGLVAQSLIPLFARSFYSRQNTKTPVAISLIGMFLNGILSYFLSAGLGVVGIALGFVIASTVQCILLFVYLHRELNTTDKATQRVLNMFNATLVTQTLKILLASVLLGGVVYGSLYLLDPILDTHTVIGIFLQAAISTTLGGIAYIALTRYLDVMESKAIANGVFKVLRFITGRKVDDKPVL